MKKVTMTLLAVAALALAACASGESTGYNTFGECAEGETALNMGRTTFCQYPTKQ